MTSTPAQNIIQISIGWRQACTIVGGAVTISLAMVGLGFQAVWHLDSQLSQQVDSVRKDLRAGNAQLNQQVESVRKDLNQQVDSVRKDLNQQVESVRRDLRILVNPQSL